MVQERRVTAAAALSHPYVDDGRLRYHTCMCQCCPNSPADGGVRYTTNVEPVCSTPFHYVFEDELNSISRVKGPCYSPSLILTGCLPTQPIASILLAVTRCLSLRIRYYIDWLDKCVVW